jgi:hypothetical protein
LAREIGDAWLCALACVEADQDKGGDGDVLAVETKANVLGRSWRRCTRLAESVKRPPS